MGGGFPNVSALGGTNTIEFPDPEETSLVVILAPNNTGKTTILRAIDFLFYGSLGGEGAETSWKLVTDVIRDETQAGTEVKAWVEARLKFPDNQTLTVRRQITARRPTENKWMAESPKLLWRKTDSPNEKFQADDGHYQVKIDNAVPQDLFSWFYFQGEPANGKMGRGATASVLEPLKKVLQIRRWKDARNNVQAVIQSLTQQEAKEAGANKAYTEIRHRESVVRKGLETNRLDLNALKTAEAELGRSKARLDTELAEVSSQAKASQELYAQLQKHKLDEQQAQQAIKTADSQVCDLVKGTLAIPLLQPAFGPADRHLEDLRTRNLLPADVSKGFIERLLKGEQCVCGTCLDETKRAELTKYLGLTLAAQTNRDLVALADALEGGKESALRKKAASFPARLTRLNAERGAAVALLKRAQDAIEGLMPKIEKGSMDRFSELVNLVRKAEREIADNQRSQAEKAESIRRQESALAGLATELAKARPKKGADKMEGIAKAIEMAEMLQMLREKLNEGETKFRQAVHGILQERLTHYFGVATSGNTAWIDKENFLPSMHDRNNLVVTNPGGGEQQVLNLAFVIALAEMRTMINEDMTSAGLGGRLLGDQSFVLDSPFTSADPNFMKAIAEFLPGKAPQMLLLLAKQNWPDSVRDTLAPHISRVYGVRLHTSVTPNDPEAFRFDWKGKTVDLREPIAAGQPSFSTSSRTLNHGRHPPSSQRQRMSSVKFRPLRSSQATQFRKPRSIAGHCGR
jgi:DNA sulfur modification protein DndD